MRGGATDAVQLVDAIAAYRAGLADTDPQKGLKLRYNLALLLEQLGEQDEAASFFQQVAESASENLPPAARRRSLVAVGAAAQRGGDWANAEEFYRRALFFDDAPGLGSGGGAREMLGSEGEDWATAFDRICAMVLRQVHARVRDPTEVIVICRRAFERLTGSSAQASSSSSAASSLAPALPAPSANLEHLPLVLSYWAASVRRQGIEAAADDGAGDNSDGNVRRGTHVMESASVESAQGARFFRDSAELFERSADAARAVFRNHIAEKQSQRRRRRRRRRLFEWARACNFAGVAWATDVKDYGRSDTLFGVALTLLLAGDQQRGAGEEWNDGQMELKRLKEELPLGGAEAMEEAAVAAGDVFGEDEKKGQKGGDEDENEDEDGFSMLLADVWTNYGVSLKGRSDSVAPLEKNKLPSRSRAIAALERAVAISNGQNGHALVQLASLQTGRRRRSSSSSCSSSSIGEEDGDFLPGLATCSRLPREYVASLFDQYSDDFEVELVAKLRYIGPSMLEAAVAKAEALAAKDERAANKKLQQRRRRRQREPSAGYVCVDIGCGTGLCGAVFRDRAEVMIGLDLSQRMVHIARTKQPGLYDAVVVSDAADFFREGLVEEAAKGDEEQRQRQQQQQRQEPMEADLDERQRKLCAACREDGSVDLVVAGDMVVYLGELAPLLQELRRVLRPGGMVTYTAEELKEELPSEGEIPLQGGGIFHDDEEDEDDDADSAGRAADAKLKVPSSGGSGDRRSGNKSNGLGRRVAGEGMRLMPSGRFSHSRRYIAESAAAAGLEAVVVERHGAMRFQRGVPVPGFAVVLRKKP